VRAVARATPAGRRYRVPVVLLVALLTVVGIVRREATTPESWTVGVGSDPVAVAVAPRSGRVVVANSGDQTVSILDARSGSVLATVPLGHAPTAIALDEAHSRAFTLNSSVISGTILPQGCQGAPGSVSVLDLPSATLLGTTRVGPGAGVIAVDDHTGHVFVANPDDDTLSILDSRTGYVRRTLDVGGPPLALAVDTRLHRVGLSIAASVSQARLLDSGTGAFLRTIAVGRFVFVGAVLSDARAGRLLLSSTRGLYLLDAGTGQTLLILKEGGLPLAVDERDGRALIAGRQGHLRLVATHDGALVGPIDDHGALRTLSIDAVAVDEAAGRFYVAAHGALTQAGTSTKRLVVLEGRSGRVLRTLALHEAPVALAVDAAAHRAFIVNSGTSEAPAGRDGGRQITTWLRHTMPWLPLPANPPAPATGTVTVLDTSDL
jgi:YVTN family beta-propeller protein